MSSGGHRRELTEREALGNDVRMTRARYAFCCGEMERAEARIMAFAAAERAEMEKASGIEPAGM